jgi:hypothetical protein
MWRSSVTLRRALVAVAIVTGIAFRWVILTHALGTVESDEAVTGLMARHLLQGQATVFFWGQQYGGTLESFLTAPLFALFGSSVFVLKSVPIVLHAVAALLLWRIGRRLFGPTAGIVAGLALWLWPAAYVLWSTKARAFYASGMVLGLVMLLCALRIGEDDRRWRDWLIFGLAGGLGWWGSPQIVWLAIPAFLWIAVSDWRSLRWLPLTVIPFLIGAAPWLAWNLRHHFQSLTSPAAAVPGTYVDHLRVLARSGLPLALGLRVSLDEHWLFARPVALAIYGVVLALAIVVLLTRRQDAKLLIIALGFFPFIWAVSPLTSYVGDGRYLFLITPFLALLIAAGLSRPIGVIAGFAVLTALTLTGLAAIPHGGQYGESGRLIPRSMTPLIQTLQTRHDQFVFTEYWLAYRLTFESRERIIAAPIAAIRYPPYNDKVAASPDPVYVFVAGSAQDQQCGRQLERLGVGLTHLTPGGFSVYIPDHKVLPSQLALC